MLQKDKSFVISLVWFTILLVSLTGFLISSEVPLYVNQTDNVDKLKKEEISGKFARIQMPFIEYLGQLENSVAFYAKTVGAKLSVTKEGELIYNLPKRDEDKAWAVRERLLNALSPTPKGGERAVTKLSYFRGNDPSKWKTQIPTYSYVSLGEIYEGIELKLKAYGNNVAKLFTVKPSSSPQDIKVFIEGTEGTRVDDQTAELIAETELGEVRFAKTVPYQEIEEKRRHVEVGFNIHTAKERQTYPLRASDLNESQKDFVFAKNDLSLSSYQSERLQTSDLTYLGAFRLPDDFNWGALGLSFYPKGDDGAGTLLITGYQQLYDIDHPGEACWNPAWNCNAYYGEIRIPAPQKNSNWEDLPAATLLRPMTNFDGGLASTVHREYLFVSDLEYVPRRGSQTSDKLYGSINLWFAEGVMGTETFPTIWFSNLDGSNPRGMFHVGPEENPYHGRKMGSCLFSVPPWYADQYLGGRTLITGRARGTPASYESVTTIGGSQGPTLFAFHPWDSDNPLGNLDALPVLYYRVAFPGCAGPNVGDPANCDYPNYTMCDNWEGGAFVDNGQKRAIMLLGWKGLGSNCYDEPPVQCNDLCSQEHGYHCYPYEHQVIFYDVHELGQSALGLQNPWLVLPYTIWRPAEFYTKNNPCQNSGGMAYDERNRRLFLVERGLGGDTNYTVVHVWQVSASTTEAFIDVSSDYWAYNYIIAIYNNGITTGCAQDDPNTPENERRYCPEDSVTRGQMAAFIIRAKYGETFSYTTTAYFTDVPSTHVFFKYVQKLKDDGITALSGTYGVDSYVTRGQMAAFIIRAKHGESFSYTTTPYFSDVPSTHNFFKYVQKLRDDGITTVSGTYGVDNIVTRAQMAAFLARAFLGMQ